MKLFSGKFAAGLAAAMILAAPFAAGALTADDIQVQIKALMQQITELQLKIKTLQTTSVSVDPATSISAIAGATTPASNYRICALLNRNLSVGSQGDDVSGLQEFLYQQKILTVTPTGYFGSLTADAVRRWQANEGVSVVGSFGPMSRDRIKVWCGGNGGSSNTERFSASPTRGNAPLAVVFDTWLSGFRINTVSYNIDYGDGSTEPATNCYAPADGCLSAGQNTHTYTANGTYTATLNKVTNNCPAGAQCFVGPTTEVVAKQQINVGVQTQSSNFSADPMNGGAPLSVGFTYQPGEENGQYYIEYGDGSGEQMTFQQIYCIRAPCISPFIAKHVYKNVGTYTANVSRYVACLYSNPRCMIAQPAPLAQLQITVTGASTDPSADRRCKAWYDGCNTCSRNSADSPAMCTLKACIQGAMARPYCTAYFDDSTANKLPTISGFSGPTSLALNTSGTWTINASDPEGGTLSYSVWWGDENVYAPSYLTTAGAARDFIQSTTFTHAYANAGTYTVTIVARDSAGQEAKSSSTVKVGSDAVACTMEYAPVCGRPAGCANTCAPGMACPAICQLYPAQTYSNRCALNAAGATVLYSGQCTSINSYNYQ